MNRSARARLVMRRLDEAFPRVEPSLDSEEPFTMLVSTVLSAQCTDARVNEVTPHLFARARTPEQMVRLGVVAIRRIIRPCGLSVAKSRSLHGLSRLILDRFGGRVPDSFEALESLPGVGHKTASVVMGRAFGKAAFPVDTHVHRLARRWGLSDGTSVVKTERDLKALFPEKRWYTLHLQMIYYGRRFCTARGCDGMKCPLCVELRRGGGRDGRKRKVR
jgi:endonuclease III